MSPAKNGHSTGGIDRLDARIERRHALGASSEDGFDEHRCTLLRSYMLNMSIYGCEHYRNGPAYRPLMLDVSINDAMSTLSAEARLAHQAGRDKRQLGPGDGALEQHLAPEPEQLGRPAAGRVGNLAGFLDQALLVDQPAEILLVQPLPGERLDGALQLQAA